VSITAVIKAARKKSRGRPVEKTLSIKTILKMLCLKNLGASLLIIGDIRKEIPTTFDKIRH
jgi:hypothetical protein